LYIRLTDEVLAMRVAAIGIGSNSLRMLVADLLEGKLIRLKRYREGLRVFAALDDQGNITEEMIRRACQSISAFQEEALAQGAERIHLFATSAVRDAANQLAFSGALLDATGLSLEICSGDEEARLSFWGASESYPTGLIDIGGGSTELAIGCGRKVDDAHSLQMGAVRLYRMQPITSVEEAMKVVAMAQEIAEPVKKRFLTRADRSWVGVGGTFTTSAAVVQRIPWQQREKIHGYELTQQAVEKIIDYLAPMPIQERLQLSCLQPQRADIVVHGVAILLACMKTLRIPSIAVSEYGNLEGYLKVKYLFGEEI